MKKVVYFIICIILTGCSSFGKTQPQIHYMFSGSTFVSSHASQSGRNIQVMPMRVVTQFANNGFVYRTGSTTYLSDYYHVFFIAPEDRLTQLTAASISQCHHFAAVGDSQNPLTNPTYYLAGTIETLYADYQNKQRPMAVLSIRYVFTLRNGTILFDKTYSTAVPLKIKTTQALMNAWDGEVQSILHQLNKDLAQHQSTKKRDF